MFQPLRVRVEKTLLAVPRMGRKLRTRAGDLSASEVAPALLSAVGVRLQPRMRAVAAAQARGPSGRRHTRERRKTSCPCYRQTRGEVARRLSVASQSLGERTETRPSA